MTPCRGWAESDLEHAAHRDVERREASLCLVCHGSGKHSIDSREPCGACRGDGLRHEKMCRLCWHEPACGQASITTDHGTTWWCHDDAVWQCHDASGRSCYEQALQNFVPADPEARMANGRSDLWYGKGEGGETLAREEASADETDNHPSLRCSCEACLSSRAAIRENAIHGAPAPKSGARGAWADRSWDGPLADFPGHSYDDTRER